MFFDGPESDVGGKSLRALAGNLIVRYAHGAARRLTDATRIIPNAEGPRGSKARAAGFAAALNLIYGACLPGLRPPAVTFSLLRNNRARATRW